MHLHRPHPTLAEPAPDAARAIVANIDNSRSVGAGIEGDIVHNGDFHESLGWLRKAQVVIVKGAIEAGGFECVCILADRHKEGVSLEYLQNIRE